MNDRNLVILGSLIGGVVGVVAGFVLFTERGRQLRAELQPEIEAVVREAMRLVQVVDDIKRERPATTRAAAATAAWPRRTP